MGIQRIPSSIGNYLAGFADGEGSFHVTFRRRKDFRVPWKTSLCFNVSQREQFVLSLFRRHLGCGTLRVRPDGVWYYEVNNLKDIRERVIPFFQRFPFLSEKKRRDFACFQRLSQLLERRAHLSEEGLRKILRIRSAMNDGGAGRRKYADREIVDAFAREKSPEAIRQARAGHPDAASPAHA